MAEFRDSLNLMGMNTQNIVALFLIVGLVTGGNLWLHRNDPPLGSVQYSEFGFTFTHKSEGYVDIGSLSGGGNPTYSNGRYSVTFETDELLQIGFFWTTYDDVPVSADENILKMSLDMLFESAESEGTQLTRENEFIPSEKNGHEMLYQYFEVYDSGFEIPGIIGAWQCEERIFLFFTIYLEDFENPIKDSEKLMKLWSQNLKQFKCH